MGLRTQIMLTWIGTKTIILDYCESLRNGFRFLMNSKQISQFFALTFPSISNLKLTWGIIPTWSKNLHRWTWEHFMSIPCQITPTWQHFLLKFFACSGLRNFVNRCSLSWEAIKQKLYSKLTYKHRNDTVKNCCCSGFDTWYWW